MATSTLGSGTVVLAGTTSGTTTVTATAVVGTTTLTLPAATDTLVGKATTDTLTNKTLTSATLTGVVTFDAGTAAAPAITTTGDTNTGIFFPAADTIAFAEGGVESMRIDSSGNVGIGVTPSASVKLQVKTATNQDLAVISSSFVAGGVGLAAVNDAFNAYTALDFQGSSIQMGTGGTERMRIDSSGNVLVTSAAGLGYGTGSGGTVTQATSKSTGVTLNKPTGQITMNNAALAASTNVSFQLTNSLIALTDTLICSITTAANYSYQIQTYCGAGSAQILLRNIDSVSRSEAIVINFAIIKGVTA